MPDIAQPTNQAVEAWEKVELLRRLYRIIEAADGQGGVSAVARTIGVAKATLYRFMWAERRPSYTNLLKLYAAYPDQFPELKVLAED